METLSVHDIQTNISSILEKREKEGKSFLIFRDGKPVADLIPHQMDEKENIADVENRVKEKTPLQKLSQAGAGIPPSKELRKASLPTITVKGKELSRMITEDRR
ncbi:hypothetical protein QUF72_01560 [Desulfobacterales bacterium HSG2]|nr:hypothetical protein [Desulfobacterales bacterium HSG2]